MTNQPLKRFLVTYQIPAAVMDGWMQTDPKVRETSEAKLRGEWQAWDTAHAKMIVDSRAGGKTKRVTASGVAAHRNDVVITQTIEAESLDAAAKSLEGHPHLQIPQALIEVMELRDMRL